MARSHLHRCIKTPDICPSSASVHRFTDGGEASIYVRVVSHSTLANRWVSRVRLTWKILSRSSPYLPLALTGSVWLNTQKIRHSRLGKNQFSQREQEDRSADGIHQRQDSDDLDETLRSSID